MKYFAILAIFFLSLVALTPISFARVPGEPFHVVVDPGHGGTDGGAVRGRLRESDIALTVAKKVAERLSKAPGYKVTLTRDSDVTVPLIKRSNLAKKTKGHLFISIHVNSALDQRAQGAEFYFQNQLPPEEESLFLANQENQVDTETVVEAELEPSQSSGLTIIKEDLEKTYHLYMARELGKNLRDLWKNEHHVVHSIVKQGPFHVISNVPMPSLLIELGFISHPKEAKWLGSIETQEKLADTIFDGICHIKERMDKLLQNGHITANAN